MRQSRCTVGSALVGLALLCGAWTARADGLVLPESAVFTGNEIDIDQTGVPAARATAACLVLVNETTCPIEIWIDDELLCVCEPFLRYRVWSRRSGDVTLFGRSRCDTWGPVTKTLKSGNVTTWRLSESERR